MTITEQVRRAHQERIHDHFDTMYRPLSLEPCEITLHLHSPPALYDPLHLDALLAKVVVEDAISFRRQLPPSTTPYELPVPLEVAWTSDAGLPLWKSTDFVPLETNTVDSSFWHKRAVDPALLPRVKSKSPAPKDAPSWRKRGKPMNIRGTQGPLKEYRIPLPVHSCMVWRATCVGDIEAISKLLRSLSSVGKKRSQGYGRVESWEIASIPEFSFFEENKPLRPIPTPYLQEHPIEEIGYTAWTPPYWAASSMMMCHIPQANYRLSMYSGS